MSSILDALNKLEQEKAQAVRDHEQDELDPAITAHDLVGRSVLRDRVTLRVTPMALLLSIGTLVIVLIVVAFVAALTLARNGEKPAEQTAAAVDATALSPTPFVIEPAPAPEPVVEAPATAAEVVPAPAAVEPAPVEAAPAETAPPVQTLPSPQSTAFIPQPDVVTPSAGPVTSPAVVARQPEPKPEPPAAVAPEVKPEVQQAPPAPVSAAPTPGPASSAVVPPSRDLPAAVELEDLEEPTPRTRVAAAPVNDAEDDPLPPPRRTPPAPKTTATPPRDVAVDRLPEFTAMEQMKYGFDRVKINMMKPADATNPRGSALITFTETSDDGSSRTNRMRFLEGERILQTPLRLFKVESDRVGIEDVRTGDRYQLPF